MLLFLFRGRCPWVAAVFTYLILKLGNYTLVAFSLLRRKDPFTSVPPISDPFGEFSKNVPLCPALPPGALAHTSVLSHLPFIHCSAPSFSFSSVFFFSSPLASEGF